MKLISMTDFVLEHRLKYAESFKSKVYAYANFLKQPLTLGIFVPCDEDGNVMNTNSIYDPRSKTGMYYPWEIDNALNKILFENINIIGEYITYKDFGLLHILEITDKKIENLIMYELELTPSALKQIGI